MDYIGHPPCKKGIRPGICEKPAVLHKAGDRVRYSWLIIYILCFFCVCVSCDVKK